MISIVIPNYNGERYLRECLASIEEQTETDYEIIIIDNASTDANYEWLKETKCYFKQLDRNYGFSRAVNEGIHLAKGEYVLLLNNDTVLAPDFLLKMKQCIEKDKRIFAVSSKMITYQDRSIIDDAGDEYTILGWTLKCGDGKSVRYYTKEREVFSACAGAALYRKEVFEKIGDFDEQFFAYMEDVDISYRGRIYGYRNVYCPDAHVYHIGSATSGSRYNAFKVKLAARNNIYVPYKNMPFLQLLLNLPFLGVGMLLKWIFFTKKGFGKLYLEGVREGLMQCTQLTKVPFKFRHLKNYIKIEGLLIINTFKLIQEKLRRTS